MAQGDFEEIRLEGMAAEAGQYLDAVPHDYRNH
jgi:hypothetical protein